MPVYQLEIEEDYTFDLIGIASHEKNYRLAWAINKSMRWMLVRKPDILLRKKKDECSSHALFQFIHPIDQILVSLVDNKTENGMLMPELKQFDYVLKMEDASHILNSAFYKELRSVSLIQAVHTLEISKLKSKHHLVFDNAG